MNISIIGGGAWGTTLAQVLADNKNNVLIRDINLDFVNKINVWHFHPSFAVSIPESIKATSSLEEAVNYSDIIVLCVPTKVIRSVISQIDKLANSQKLYINVSKGIEPETGDLVSDIVKEVTSPNKIKGFVVLSGPSHAEELIFRKFTTLVSASTNKELAEMIQELFANNYLRVYTSTDVRGVEVGGAVKNAIAVVSGIASGLGLGENARAALICRGMKELVQIIETLGGKKETAYGLSGLGDLIVTASSMNSRNFKTGLKIGQGQSVVEAVNSSSQTVEGIRTINACYQIAKKYNLDLPIINTSYELVNNKIDLNGGVSMLLNRKLKPEN